MDLQSHFISFIKQIKLLQFGQRSLANSPYANGKKRLLFIQKENTDRAQNHKFGLRVTPEQTTVISLIE